ncbi:MAG: bacteriohemerythrin [Betaproteobacteria bacterium]|nr:bacteriohemerythrin [Betaproteobacteria bacterium]
MPFMPWSDELVLGIDSIDKQHRWLVDTTNRLHDELAFRYPKQEELEKILEGLMEYAINHFIVEEDLFNRYGYPEERVHRARHDEFSRYVLQLLLKCERGEQVSDEVLEFLRTWLVKHILTEDKAYVPFLKEKGVK